MNMPGLPRFIQTHLSSRLYSFAMNRFSSGYWKSHSPSRRKICELA